MNKYNVEDESIEWTIQKIIDSEDSIDWDIFCEYFKAGINNKSDHLLRLYYFDFFYLFENRINWSNFCKNKNIHWGCLLTDITPYKISSEVRQNYSFKDKNSFLGKTKLSSLKLGKKINLFTTYFDRWDWDMMSGNEDIPHYIWTSIFTNYKHQEAIAKLNFKKLSSLKNIPWDLTLHFQPEKNSALDYSEQWDWDKIVTNKNIKWNKKMIIDHAKHFPWKGSSGGSTGKYWYIPSILASCSHINFPSEILKEHTDIWVEGMYDGCTRSDSEGDWIVFSRNHNIDIDILKEFSLKLDLGEVVKNKVHWSLEEIILVKNLIEKSRFWGESILKNLISKENVKELIIMEFLKKL